MDTIDKTDAAPTEETAAPRQKLPLALRIVRGIGWTSIIAGLLILGFVAQQLWVTSWLAQRNQGGLESELETRAEIVDVVEVPFVPGVGIVTEDNDGVTPPSRVPSEAAGAILTYALPDRGEPIATLRIPTITGFQSDEPLEWTFVEGVTLSNLKSGAGHMPMTPIPGLPGNSVISGHRTTYGAPFHNLDKVQVGDRIYVDDPVLGTHEYEIVSWDEYVAEFPETADKPVQQLDDSGGVVVAKNALWVTDDRSGAWLTLTTCHPKWSAAKRLIVVAKLVAGPNAEVILQFS